MIYTATCLAVQYFEAAYQNFRRGRGCVTDWLQQQLYRMKYPLILRMPCHVSAARVRKRTLKLGLLKHVNNPRCLQPGPLGPPLPPGGEEVSPTIQGFRNCVSLNLLSVEMISENIVVINELKRALM